MSGLFIISYAKRITPNPNRKQYNENQISFPLFTILIIHLQAKVPVMNELRNPHIRGVEPIDSDEEKSPLTISSRFMPIMGIKTIKKEKGATSSRLFPNNNHVEMVEPERERPGRAANA